MVSCSPMRHSVVEVASSTRFIRQPRGPRPSNHSWKLPSSCTNSPKCSRRSLLFRCWRTFLARLHNPSANIQRLTVVADSSIWSSLAKCSAVKVGPKRSPTFARILLPDQTHHLRANLLRLGAIGRSPGAAVHQPHRAVLLVALPQPLALAVAHLHPLRRFDQPPRATFYLRQHRRSPQLPLAHRCSPQSCLPRRPSV